MVKPGLKQHLDRRSQELQQWLTQHAPDIEREQHHLQEGTPERAYWHYGYLIALRDIRGLLR